MTDPADTNPWHPAITEAIERRPALSWAYDNDPAMHEQVRQLNVVLHAVVRAAEHSRNGMMHPRFYDHLLADPLVLPTDSVLVQRRYEHERRVREAMLRANPVTR